MKKKIFLLFFVSIIACGVTLGQGWVAEGSMNVFDYCTGITMIAPRLDYKDASGNIIATPIFTARSNSGSSKTDYYDFVMRGNGNTLPSGQLFFAGTGTCKVDTDGDAEKEFWVDYTFSASGQASYAPPSDCEYVYFDSPDLPDDNAYIRIKIKLHPRMEISVASLPGWCDAVELRATRCATTYKWEASDNVLGPWKVIEIGQSQTIKPTTADFVRVDLNKTGQKYFRLTGDVAGTTSEIVQVNVYPSGPSATLASSAPTCTGGSDWSIDINDIKKDPLISSVKADVYLEGGSFPIASRVSALNSLKITADDFATGGDPTATYRIRLSNESPTIYGICSTDLGTVTIPARLPLTASEVVVNRKNPSCYNSSDGEITVDLKNVHGNYSVFVNGTARAVQALSNQFTITGLVARQNYSIVVRDSYCEALPISVTLNSPDMVTAKMTVPKALKCADSKDGQLQVSVTGGKAPSIMWSTNETTSIISNLEAGTYSATIKDAGCPDVVASYTLVAPPALGIVFKNTMPTCEGIDNGQVKVERVTNAGLNLSYTWYSADGETIGTLPSVSRRLAGTYRVIVTDNASACSVTQQTVLENPPGVTVKINPVLAFNNFPLRCNGDNNGKLEVSVADPNNQLTQTSTPLWSTGDYGTHIENLSEGIYTVSIPYGNNCLAKDSYALKAPDALSAAINLAVNYHGLPISCHGKNDGELYVTAVGGAGNYRYAWNDGSTGLTKKNIGSGTYRVTVTDINNCTTETAYTVKSVTPVEVLLVSQSNYAGFGVSCYDSSDGFITTTATGGTGKYSYVWSNYQEGATIQALSPAEYRVIATDENGCSASLEHTITKPNALALSIENFVPIKCNSGNDGSITLKSSGGAGSYEFSVDNGFTWQSSSVFNSLKASQYVLKLRDKNGCQASIEQMLTEPSAISIDFQNIKYALCNDPKGSAMAVVSGGSKEYTYSWKNSQGQNVNDSKDLRNVPGGVYALTVSDQSNCRASKLLPIMSEDGPLASYTATAARCYDTADGTASLTITRGQSPVIIQWSDGRLGLQGTGLSRGTHYVTLTDGNNCATAKTIEIGSPDLITVNAKVDKLPSCYGSCDGVVTLQASGGVGNFEYEWNKKNAASQSDLCNGVYPVIVRDSKACTRTSEIFLPQPDPIKIETVEIKSPTCAGVCDGTVTLAAVGGNGNYHFTWPDGQVSSNQKSLCGGLYKIMLTDGEGCKAEKLVAIAAPTSTAIDLGGGIALCEGKEHTLDIGPRWLHQRWSSSTGFTSNSQLIKINTPGKYWVEATDASGCIAKDTFLLETATDLLNASFLLSSDGYVGDTIVMVEITRPMPDVIHWTYPHEMIVLDDMEDVVFGKFNSAGTYKIKLAVSSGGCHDEIEKTITILEKTVDDEGGRLGYEAFVKKFELHPNPNNGNFDVTVELLEESPVLFTVWDGSTNRMIKKDSENGNQFYTVHFDLRPLSSGMYVIRLDHARGKAFLRFVVQ